MAEYDAILFDLDGTLLNTIELIVRSYQHTFRQHLAREVERGRILEQLGRTLYDHLELYAPKDPDLLGAMVQTYRTFNLANHDELALLFPGVADALRELRAQGYRLAVVSSKVRPTVLRGLQLFSLESLFETLVCFEDTEAHKPDPAPVKLALQRLGVLPERALMVGDSPADLEAGRQAGTRTASVGWSVFPQELLAKENPDLALSCMGDLTAACGPRGGTTSGCNQ